MDVTNTTIQTKTIPTTYEPRTGLSRYGNPLRYHVAGKTYDVRSSSLHFKEKGIASWYGHPFHKERTSSGETYDMYAMTAAHKTLPLPSYVKVTNIENGRSVTVKVNDRGPFHDGRVIDLSFAAAKELNMIKKGTAPVVVEALDVDKPKAHWYLQAGSFHENTRAMRFGRYLQALIKAPVRLIKRSRETLVHIGPFNHRQQTLEAKSKLGSYGVHDLFAFMQ